VIEAFLGRGGPNPLKLVIFLEEVEVPHRRVWLQPGEDFRRSPEFLRMSPHGKLPAMIDHAPADSGAPIEIFESAAMLYYLGDKTGQLLPTTARGRADTLKWVAWQVAALGPTSGQAAHFDRRPAEESAYTRDRFMEETRRLYGILDRQLADHGFVAGDNYSIADVACFPWIHVHGVVGVELGPYPGLTRWMKEVAARPAVARAIAEAMPAKSPAGS